MNATRTAAIQNASPSSARAWFVVVALSLASIVSWIDRQVINLLVEPIKADLGLSDVQISLLQGFSFALLYALMAVPLAWLADRHNRKWVIIGGIACWSVATFSSGLAMTFGVLFAMRMMVGIGEATLAPAGFSMISDYFPKEKVPTAVSVFTGSGFAGSGLALIVGGYLYAQLEAGGSQTLPFGTFAPWQLTFMAVALISVPLFLLLFFFLREPPRREENVTLGAEDAPPAFEIVSFLRENAFVFFPLMLGFACFTAAQYGIGAWAPSYFIRIHGWTQLDVGQHFGPVVMVAGVGGVVLGGMLAERWLARGISDATIRIPLIAIALALPCAIVFPLLDSAPLSLALLGLVLFFGTVPFGAGVATFPLITPNRMRAQVIALYLFVANLLGYSAGPILIAWLTDEVFGDPLSIDASLAIAAPGVMALGIVLVVLALAPYRSMLRAAQTKEN